MAACFPRLFLMLFSSANIYCELSARQYGGITYITPPLCSLGCQVLGTKLARKIPPCTVQDSTVYLVRSHRDLWDW